MSSMSCNRVEGTESENQFPFTALSPRAVNKQKNTPNYDAKVRKEPNASSFTRASSNTHQTWQMFPS